MELGREEAKAEAVAVKLDFAKVAMKAVVTAAVRAVEETAVEETAAAAMAAAMGRLDELSSAGAAL